MDRELVDKHYGGLNHLGRSVLLEKSLYRLSRVYAWLRLFRLTKHYLTLKASCLSTESRPFVICVFAHASTGLDESGPPTGGVGGGGGGGVPDRGCLRTPDTPLVRAESTPVSQPGPPTGAEEAPGGLELGGGGSGSGGGAGGGSPKCEEASGGNSEAAPTS